MLRKFTRLLLVTLLCAPLSAIAEPFDKNSLSFSFLIGSGRAYSDNYTVLGVGVGYYLLDGLQLGLDYEYWAGGEPTIQQISPRINYVFARQSTFSPYVGGFYRKTKIDTLPDTDAWGGRAGTYMRSGESLILGFGVAYIEYNDCQDSIYDSCSDIYPEFSLGVTY